MATSNNTEKIPFRIALRLFFASVKRVWQLDKGYVILSFFVLTLGVIPDTLGALITAIFNRRLIEGSETYASYFQVFYPLLIVFAVNLLDNIFFGIWRWAEITSIDKITSHMLRESVKKASMLDFASYDDPELYNKLQKGWSQDGKMFISSATTVFTTISRVVGFGTYITLLAYIDWKLMLVVSGFQLCVNPLTNKYYRWVYQLNNKLAEKRRKEQYYRGFFGKKGMSAEGRLFGLYQYAEENYLKAHNEIYKETFFHSIKVSGIKLLSNLIYHLPVAAGYVYLSICVWNGTVTLANMTLFVSLYVGFVNQVYNTVNSLTSFRSYAEKSRYSREFMEIPTHIYTDEDDRKERVEALKNGHVVEFQNVTFRYPGTEKNVLEDISFTVNGNETVSIIGMNGAGKTTLIQLLMRIYDPTEGVILLDGKNIKEYSAESLYAIYGTLFQDYCNYAMRAEESIILTTAKASAEKLSRVLHQATANRFVYDLPRGLDTSLSRAFDKDGTELSVGQNQRIALARALYKDAQVLILDEPSASIDPESESQILDAIHEMRGTKNIWLISHRLSTCVISDRILLFQNGKLCGNGPHSQLMQNNEEYARMFRLQADRYEVTQ